MLHLAERPRLAPPLPAARLRRWWRSRVSAPITEMYERLDDSASGVEDVRLAVLQPAE